jgi:hypothetical protein
MKIVLNNTLEGLRATGPEVVGDNGPNHGPIAPKALVALGCVDAVPKWVDCYHQGLGPMPMAAGMVTRGDPAAPHPGKSGEQPGSPGAPSWHLRPGAVSRPVR